MNQPSPTPVFRFFHLDNLHVYLRRERLYSPNTMPQDGIIYRPIHEVDIQNKRASTVIPCGRNGVIHDYVPFYLGYRSPMLLTISKKVKQSDIIYLYCSAQEVVGAGYSVAFSDGHGIMRFTKWYDSISDLSKLDWAAIYAKYWKDTPEQPDLKRRKQAEFLVHDSLSWDLVSKIVVMDWAIIPTVESIFKQYDPKLTKEVIVRPSWYY